MSEPHVLIEVNGTTYAVPSRDVLHIEMVEVITTVPNAAPFVDGIVLSRGQVVPVVNLRARFGFERIAPDLRARLLVVQSGGRVCGFLVDAAREFVRLDGDTIRPPLETIARATGPYVVGTALLGERLVLVLDVSRLLDPLEPEVLA